MNWAATREMGAALKVHAFWAKGGEGGAHFRPWGHAGIPVAQGRIAHHMCVPVVAAVAFSISFSTLRFGKKVFLGIGTDQFDALPSVKREGYRR